MRPWLLPALVLALAVASGCSGDEESAGPEPSGPATTRTPSESATPLPPVGALRLALLPDVVQPGPTPAASVDAPVFVASGRPAAAGASVTLQQRVEGEWAALANAPLDDAGVARFEDGLPTEVAGRVFRAVVMFDGTLQARSNEVTGTGWTTQFVDEFSGAALDTSTWNYRNVGVYNPTDDGLCSKSDPRAVSVADGSLRLQVVQDPGRADEVCRTEHGSFDYYLNGRLDTQGTFGFTYGVAAARVKFQRGRGQHGAFWLQRSSVPVVPGDPEASGAEVDVAEFFGEGARDGGMGAYVYYVDEQAENVKVGDVHPETTSRLPAGDTWWDSYHVFSVQWTTRGYIYRVDGREIFRTDRGVSGVDEFLLLSLSTKDWELERLDPDLLPSTMHVDWVRVWQPTG